MLKNRGRTESAGSRLILRSCGRNAAYAGGWTHTARADVASIVDYAAGALCDVGTTKSYLDQLEDREAEIQTNALACEFSHDRILSGGHRAVKSKDARTKRALLRRTARVHAHTPQKSEGPSRSITHTAGPVTFSRSVLLPWPTP